MTHDQHTTERVRVRKQEGRGGREGDEREEEKTVILVSVTTGMPPAWSCHATFMQHFQNH